MCFFVYFYSYYRTHAVIIVVRFLLANPQGDSKKNKYICAQHKHNKHKFDIKTIIKITKKN